MEDAADDIKLLLNSHTQVQNRLCVCWALFPLKMLCLLKTVSVLFYRLYY